MASSTRSNEPGASLLAQAPHAELFRLLIEPGFRNDYQHVLPCLLRIDAAHVVMLASTGILDKAVAGDLLAVNRDLDRRLAQGEDVLAAPPAHRGLFLLYERKYVEHLGPQRGGAAHLARSRNDINATVLRMRLRARALDLLDESLDLVAAVCGLAGGQLTTLMSAFTHLQPAQPTTLAHYLAAVAAELLRALEMVMAALHAMDRCPMGAASGSGSPFPITPAMVADLLGFRVAADNSLDAVASRDYVAAVLAGFANFGVTLTRWATDFQLWASHAYGFLDWPDELVSTSSIMPQKRNSYVWEEIRSQAIRPAGALMEVWLGLKNTPFSNSVEVSAAGTSHVWPALDGIGKAVGLTRLLVEAVEVRPQRMRGFLQGSGVTMTALADHLVARHGLAFRTAHEAVARMVGELPKGVDPRPEEVRGRLEEILREATGRSIPLGEDLQEALDPEAAMRATAHGGGPAPATVADQLARLQEQRHRLALEARSWRERLASADARLQQAIQGLIPA